MFGRSYEKTCTLELGMEARRAGIPPDDRCKRCGGGGHLAIIGCAMTHSIYTECGRCHGTGRESASLEACLRREKAVRKLIERGRKW